MYKQFKKFAKIDITKQKMEVAPTAHYSMGGIYVDHKTGKTSVKGLYAIGEVTAGVHGGNRLGGNSLAEITVFGRLTGKQLVKDVKKTKKLPLDETLKKKKEKTLQNLLQQKGKNPIEVKKEIQQIMWQNVGVERNEKKMKKALQQLQKFKKTPLNVGRKLKMNEKLIAVLDIKNMLPTCEMIIKSALLREESRAAHYRSDYKQTKTNWKKNILCVPTKKGFKLQTKPVKKIPKEIQKQMNKKRKLSAKLLE